MSPFTIVEEDLVELPHVIQRIRYCLRNKIGFSLVRIGDAENQVMAQGLVYSEEEIRKIWWANNEDWTGVILPNYDARDRLIASVRDADIVGVLHQNAEYEWKSLTETVFSAYCIKPRQLCYAFINTYMVDNPEFIDLLKKNRVLLIGKHAPSFGAHLKEMFRIEAAGIIMINNYYNIPRVLDQARLVDYDLALISAGSNAVILATAMARQGKVTIDFGSAMRVDLWKSLPPSRGIVLTR